MIPKEAKIFVIITNIGIDITVLKINSLITSQKLKPILLLTRIIPVSDIKTNWVNANTPIKKS